MKQLALFSIFMMMLQFSVSAQTKEKREREDQLIVDLTYETLLNNPDDIDFKWYNNGVNVHLMYDAPIKTSSFSGAIGIGISSQSYYSNGQLRVEYDSTRSRDMMVWNKVDTNYRNNKISTTYIEVPVEFRWRSEESPSGYRWKVAVGAKFGYLIDTHDKMTFNNSDRDKYKTYIFPEMNQYRVGTHIRVGYGKVNLTAFYSITPWINEGRGLRQNQLSIGVSILPF